MERMRDFIGARDMRKLALLGMFTTTALGRWGLAKGTLKTST